MRRQPRAFASLGGSKMEATLLPPSTSSISKPGRRMRPCGRSGKECWPNTRLARPVGRLRQVSPSRHLCSVPLNYYPLAGATQGPVLPYVFPEQPLETEAQRKAALARQAGGGAKKKKKQASRAKADRKGKGKARAVEPESSEEEVGGELPGSPLDRPPSPDPTSTGSAGETSSQPTASRYPGSSTAASGRRDFKDMAPAAVVQGDSHAFLESLDVSRQYQALQAHLRKGFGNSGGGSVTALRGPQSPIPGAPWSTWGWAQAWLPEAVHSRPDGLQPLFSFLEKEKGRWVSGGIQLEMAGQVLLTVGLVLRDLSTAQFVNDPDDRPSGVPAYVFDSKLGFKEYNHLLDILEELKAVRVLRSGVAGTSIAPAPSQPSGSTRPKPRPAYQGIRMAGDVVNADHDELELSEELLAKTSPPIKVNLTFSPTPSPVGALGLRNLPKDVALPKESSSLPTQASRSATMVEADGSSQAGSSTGGKRKRASTEDGEVAQPPPKKAKGRKPGKKAAPAQPAPPPVDEGSGRPKRERKAPSRLTL